MRRVPSDNPLVCTKGEVIGVSANFSAYVIRSDGKVLSKIDYKSRLGRPCIGQKLLAFPSKDAIFLFELSKGKPAGIIPTKAGLHETCAFDKSESLYTSVENILLKLERTPEGKYKIVQKKVLIGNILSIDYNKKLVVGTTEGLYIGKKFLNIGRVNHVKVGPYIASSIPYGFALYDFNGKEILEIDDVEVSGIVWLGDLIAIGDRSRKRILIIDTSGNVVRELKFTGSVRSFDWDVILVVAHRKKVHAYLLTPTKHQ